MNWKRMIIQISKIHSIFFFAKPEKNSWNEKKKKKLTIDTRSNSTCRLAPPLRSALRVLAPARGREKGAAATLALGAESVVIVPSRHSRAPSLQASRARAISPMWSREVANLKPSASLAAHLILRLGVPRNHGRQPGAHLPKTVDTFKSYVFLELSGNYTRDARSTKFPFLGWSSYR